MLPSDKATNGDRRTGMACCRRDLHPNLRVSVLFTTPEATLLALRKAAALAARMQARILLIAVDIVPFRLSLGVPIVPSHFLERQLLSLVAKCGIDAAEIRIEIFLCRDQRACLKQVLQPRSLVVVGGKTHWWSREKRLRHWLVRLGHEVVFVDVNRAQSVSRIAVRLV